jgi:transposase
MLRLLVAVPEKIEAVAGRVRERAPGERQALLLATVPGLGYYTALLARAENKECLPLPDGQAAIELRRLGAFHLRLWKAVRHAAIAKRGFSFLRWTLVEAAMHVVGRPGPCRSSTGGCWWARAPRRRGGAPARKVSKAVFWMLSMSRFYRKVGPCLAPQGQASSGAYVAGG